MNNNISTHNQTVPTTIGALLTEECTIDPLSHLPSFLELTFVDVARNSGRRALSAAWGVGVSWLEGAMERLHRLERMADRMTSWVNNSEGSSPPGPRLLNAIGRITTQLARIRIRVLRRMCQLFLGAVKTFGPEFQALIMYAIDYHCMHYLAGATACEMVYGLKRSKIIKPRHPLVKTPEKLPNLPDISNSQPKDQLQLMTQNTLDAHRVAGLTKFEKTCSALLAALLPYWKERCDQCYGEWKEAANSSSVYQVSNGLRNRSSFNTSKERFLQLYPNMHLVHEVSIFLYQFAYLMGYTRYWSFSLHALGVVLRRMTVADVQQQQQQKKHRFLSQHKSGVLPLPKTAQALPMPPRTDAISYAKKPSMQIKPSLPQILWGAVLFSVSYKLISGWYSHFKSELRIRRHRWITGDDNQPTPESETIDQGSQMRPQLPIPPPPMPPNLLNQHDENIDKWSCPICKEPRINPTASSSGYAFCYKCLVFHLRKNGSYCPVTGMPCWESKVVRLFEPTASGRGAAVGSNNATNR